MGNKISRDILDSVEVEELKIHLTKYQEDVYRGEFGEGFPDDNHPDLLLIFKYGDVTCQTDINWNNIYTTIGLHNNIIQIPDVLSDMDNIINIVASTAELAWQIVSQYQALACSRLFSRKIIGKDGEEYLYTVVMATKSIDAEEWGIKGGLSYQVATTVVFKVGKTSH